MDDFLTPEQYNKKFGDTTSANPQTTPNAFNRAVSALDVTRGSDNLNIGNNKIIPTIDEIISGAAKSLTRTGVNIGRFFRPDKALDTILGTDLQNNPNNVLNRESEQGKIFDSIIKNDTPLQKTGGITTDLLSLATPGGAASKISSGAGRGVGSLGLKGFLGRNAGGITEGVTDAAIGAVATQGSLGAGDLAIGSLFPLAGGAMKQGGNLARLMSVGGKQISEERAVQTLQDAVSGNVKAQNKIEKAFDKLKNNINTVLLESPDNSRLYKIFNREGSKLKRNKLPEAEELLARSGVDIRDGRFAKGEAFEQNLKDTSEYGKQLNELITSSNGQIIPSIVNEPKYAPFISKIKTLKVGDDIIDPALAEKFTTGKPLTAVEAYTLSKALRDEAYKQATGLAGDTATDVAFRKFALDLDDQIASLSDLDQELVKELQQKVTEGHIIERLQDGLSGKRIPPSLSTSLGKNIGGTLGMIMSGFGPMGLVGGLVGRELGGMGTSITNKITSQGVNPQWLKFIQKQKGGQTLEELTNRVKQVTSKNNAARADMADDFVYETVD